MSKNESLFSRIKLCFKDLKTFWQDRDIPSYRQLHKSYKKGKLEGTKFEKAYFDINKHMVSKESHHITGLEGFRKYVKETLRKVDSQEKADLDDQ